MESRYNLYDRLLLLGTFLLERIQKQGFDLPHDHTVRHLFSSRSDIRSSRAKILLASHVVVEYFLGGDWRRLFRLPLNQVVEESGEPRDDQKESSFVNDDNAYMAQGSALV